MIYDDEKLAYNFTACSVGYVRSTATNQRIASVHTVERQDEDFEAAVTSAFQYLVEVYGFTRRPLRVTAYERFIEFEKAAVKVVVQQEMGAGAMVSLVAPTSNVPEGRREFGLHELKQEMKRLGVFDSTLTGPADESIAGLARTLEHIGPDVLNGDFSVLFARLRRHTAAVGKSS